MSRLTKECRAMGTYPMRNCQYASRLRLRSHLRCSFLVRKWGRPVSWSSTCLAVTLSDGLQEVAFWFWWRRKLNELENVRIHLQHQRDKGTCCVCWTGLVDGDEWQGIRGSAGCQAQTTNTGRRVEESSGPRWGALISVISDNLKYILEVLWIMACFYEVLLNSPMKSSRLFSGRDGKSQAEPVI